jgi:hypothetical protein
VDLLLGGPAAGSGQDEKPCPAVSERPRVPDVREWISELRGLLTKASEEFRQLREGIGGCAGVSGV